MRLFVTIATWIRPRLAVFAIVCSVLAGLIKLTSAIYPLLLKDYIDALEDGVRDLKPVIAMALLFGITTLLEVVITVGYGRAHTSLERAIKLRVFKRATHLSSRNVKERGEGFFVNLIDEAVSACMQLFLPHTYAQLFALLKTVIIVIIVMQFDVVAALIMVLLPMLHCVQFLLNKRYFTPLLDTLYRLYREASAFITERIGLISLVEAFPSFRNTIVQDSERILDRVRRRTFRVELYSETLYRAVERYLQPPARFGLLLYLGLQYIAGVDGTALSGGERRKINVARFLFHIVEREYFIIAEAFLGMDGVTRKHLLHLVKAAIGTKTGIVISHNADVIDLLSDRVVYIPGGGTPLTGTHAELARDDSSYRAILNVDSIAGFGHV